MVSFGIFRLISLFMKCLCMAPLTPAMMVTRGLVLHPLFCMVLIRGSYLTCLCVKVCSGYLSWQYVNSMNLIVCVGVGDIGVCVWFGPSIMRRIFGRNLARH